MDMLMFQKKLLRRTWCKWEKEHITVNYNYQTIMCVIFSSKAILEAEFLGGFHLSARLQGFCRGFFYSFVYTLLVCFWRCFTLEQISDNNQTDQKVINVSNRSVSCRKITQKGDKTFCRGIFFFVSCGESFFGQGSEVMSKEYACKVSRPCHFRTWSFFQRSLNDDGQTFFFPEVFP